MTSCVFRYCKNTTRNVSESSGISFHRMPPRQDLIVAPQSIRVEHSRMAPPPPAPGRLQRPPHDHPAQYLVRTNTPRRNNNVVTTRSS